MIPLAILRYQGKRLIGCDSLAWLSQVRRMASTDYTERFVSEGHSALYAKYRASHSKEFYKFIVDHLREKVSIQVVAVKSDKGTLWAKKRLAFRNFTWYRIC